MLTFTKYTYLMMIEELKILDKEFHSYGNTDRNETFEYTNRNTSLILSAPHATKSFVRKKEKLADLYTGAIVKYLGQKENTSTIIILQTTTLRSITS